MTPTADRATSPSSVGDAPRAISLPRQLSLLATVTLAWTVVGLLLSASLHTTRWVTGAPLEPSLTLAVGFLRAYPWIPFTWAAFALTARFPLERGRLLRHGAVHLLCAPPLVLAQIALFHFGGIALGLLRSEVGFAHALSAMAGERLMIFALLVGVAHAVAYEHRVREREVARAQVETQLAQAQLQALKMQLHPHFLFNTLHAISTLVHTDPRRAELMIAQLSEMLRGTLAHQHRQEVSLRDEIAALEPYLAIEQTRLGGRLAVEMRLDPEALPASVPHLLLQPLVENAIKHGIHPRRGPGRVEITATRRDGRLVLSVVDDGKGFAATPRAGGIGLENTRGRLWRLYGAEHRFGVDSAAGRGTRVEVEIPFRAAPETAR
jgi:signal transduction histidine kinase